MIEPRSARRPAPSLVTVVMPTLLRSETIDDALAGLAVQTYPGQWELVLSVNRPDAMADALQVLDQWTGKLSATAARAVDSSDVAGVSHARNVGVMAGTGELVAICDDDDVADPGWLDALVRVSADADIAGGWLDTEALNPPETWAWHIPHPRDRAPLSLGFLPYAVGSNFAIWRDVFAELGGFDETWLAGCEEIELCWRAQHAGFELAFAPDAVIAYRYRSRVRDLARQVYRYARAQPRLYKAFRDDGVRPSSSYSAFRLWLGLLRRVGELVRGPARRGVWVRLAAHRAGRVAGSLRYRVLYL